MTPEPHAAVATGRDRLVLWIWCLACFVASVSLFVYLPMSTVVELEELSEHPGPLTAFFGFFAAVALGIFVLTRGRPAFTPDLRRSLRVGTVAALVGFGCYATYIVSTDLEPAANAPKVGDTAPDFRVVDPDGREFWLLDFRGGPVLLVFYRGMW
jgi:drug/metabolite transporter (DMT)-like permease